MDLVKKMADFGNHRKTTLRWLVMGIPLVSVKLKKLKLKTIRRSKSFIIIWKAETQLLNKQVISINNTIKLSMKKRG